MDTDRVANLFAVMAGMPSRRNVARALSGLALGGAFGLLSLTESEAKGHKHKHNHHHKKHKHGLPFCAGQNTCVSNAPCTTNEAVACFCFVKAGSGEPFCGIAASGPDVDCSECAADETCVDVSAGFCQAGTRCTKWSIRQVIGRV